MQTSSLSWMPGKGWLRAGPDLPGAQLVMAFGARDWMEKGAALHGLSALFPHAHVMGCSTGGQIVADDVTDETASAIALEFSSTHVAVARVSVEGRKVRSRPARNWRKRWSGRISNAFSCCPMACSPMAASLLRACDRLRAIRW